MIKDCYKITTTAITVHLKDESPVFGECSLTVKLDDEAGGAFVVITDTMGAKINIDYPQWKRLNEAVEMLFKQDFEGV